MHADARRPGVDHATEPIGTAVVEDTDGRRSAATAACRAAASSWTMTSMMPLQFVSVHNSPLKADTTWNSDLRSPIFASRRDVARLAHRRRQPRRRRSPWLRRRVSSVAPSVSTLAPLCSREYRAIVSVVAMTARMPSILLAAIAEPMPAPSMTMPASASPRRHGVGHSGGDVRIVDRIRRVRAKIVDRESPAPQEADEDRAQSDAGMVAGDGDRPDVGFRRQRRPRPSATCPSRSTVIRRSFSVSAASGVMCPPLASITVSPRSSTRASVSVIMSKRFKGVLVSQGFQASRFRVPGSMVQWFRFERSMFGRASNRRTCAPGTSTGNPRTWNRATWNPWNLELRNLVHAPTRDSNL